MSIFSKPIDQITFEEIEAFCQQKIKENVRVEYKKDFSNNDWHKQIAKEVCAFANTQGGLLFVGIEEDGNGKPASILGIPVEPAPEQRINSVCLDRIHPPVVPEIKVCQSVL